MNYGGNSGIVPKRVLPRTRRGRSMDAFTRQYIITALWSSMDNSNDQGGEPLDANYGPEDIAPETLVSIKYDCEAFQHDHAEDIGGDVEQAGHDFWLTRNH